MQKPDPNEIKNLRHGDDANITLTIIIFALLLIFSLIWLILGGFLNRHVNLLLGLWKKT